MIENTTLVFSADVARRLLKQGYKIVDIRPDKLDPESKRSVFVFQNADGLDDAIHRIAKSRR